MKEDKHNRKFDFYEEQFELVEKKLQILRKEKEDDDSNNKYLINGSSSNSIKVEDRKNNTEGN